MSKTRPGFPPDAGSHDQMFAICSMCTYDDECISAEACLLRRQHKDPAPGMPVEPWCYIGVHAGVVQSVCVDLGDEHTAKYVADVVLEGGYVERVPLCMGRVVLFDEWPQKGAGR